MTGTKNVPVSLMNCEKYKVWTYSVRNE